MDPVNSVIMHMLFLHPAYVKTFPATFIWGCFSRQGVGVGTPFSALSFKEF